ncbi:AsnC family protein [Agromyces aerolatus]|uniref:AsnC family protein n=1 Tax=Agromyces sp. LY-1074 TaxID=3074080 RepID=UPI002866D06B|nr:MULTISPECIES: AsnC family protein [unclassified Agromyces]MDR5700302.1 AsnC family protein [Agromyces sp. LY-1074]MDR5706720.1 AsnC family protein [Agromyces sp. LY-1358]
MDSTIRTAIAAADGDDPYRALRQLHHARLELTRELDRAEALAVRRARAAGASWQVIAMALEVSKQAVHKKYGRA